MLIVAPEFPVTSITAMEGVHGQIGPPQQLAHGGRTMLLGFLTQDWGWLLNLSCLILALIILHPRGTPPSGKIPLQYSFRASFAFTAAILMLLFYIRRRPMLSRIPKTWLGY